jgi:hypothetical protein
MSNFGTDGIPERENVDFDHKLPVPDDLVELRRQELKEWAESTASVTAKLSQLDVLGTQIPGGKMQFHTTTMDEGFRHVMIASATDADGRVADHIIVNAEGTDDDGENVVLYYWEFAFDRYTREFNCVYGTGNRDINNDRWVMEAIPDCTVLYTDENKLTIYRGRNCELLVPEGIEPDSDEFTNGRQLMRVLDDMLEGLNVITCQSGVVGELR